VEKGMRQESGGEEVKGRERGGSEGMGEGDEVKGRGGEKK
jgi:hypothetical protein